MRMYTYRRRRHSSDLYFAFTGNVSIENARNRLFIRSNPCEFQWDPGIPLGFRPSWRCSDLYSADSKVRFKRAISKRLMHRDLDSKGSRMWNCPFGSSSGRNLKPGCLEYRGKKATGRGRPSGLQPTLYSNVHFTFTSCSQPQQIFFVLCFILKVHFCTLRWEVWQLESKTMPYILCTHLL